MTLKSIVLAVAVLGFNFSAVSMEAKENTSRWKPEEKWKHWSIHLDNYELNLSKSTGFYELNLSSSGGVSLGFTTPRDRLFINDIQLVEPLYYENSLRMIPPDPNRLIPSRWWRIQSTFKEDEFSVDIMNLPDKDSSYEVWGYMTWPGLPREPKHADFLGYIRVRKSPSSLAEFIQRYQWPYFVHEDLDSLNKILKENKGSWRNIKLHLDDSADPQEYRLESYLGGGQDGYVFKALPIHQTAPTVALKCYPSLEGSSDPATDLKIRNEISARSVLPPKYTVQLLSSEEQKISGMHMIIMEYVDHPMTLAAFLDKNPKISAETARKILDAIAGVPSSVKLYDLTTENILLIFNDFQDPIPSSLKDVKLIDFSKMEWGSLKRDTRLRERIAFLIKAVTDCIADEPQRKDIQQEYSEKILGA